MLKFADVENADDGHSVAGARCSRSTSLLEPTKTVAVKSRRRERLLAPNLCQAECVWTFENGNIMNRLRSMFRALHDALSSSADVVVDDAVHAAARSLALWHRNDSSSIPTAEVLQALFGGDEQALHIAKWLHTYLTRAPAGDCQRLKNSYI